MSRSTFETDGYHDGLRDAPSPPDVPVYASEYWRGFNAAQRDLAPDDAAGSCGPI